MKEVLKNDDADMTMTTAVILTSLSGPTKKQLQAE